VAGGLGEPQPFDDVGPGLGIGGGGEGDQRHLGEEAPQAAELHVFGPEIMPPLGDAVGFVNGKEGDLHLLQPLQEGIAHQTFRRHIEQLQLAVVQPRQHLACLAFGKGGVVAGRGNAVGYEGVHLVLHQRDQRGDDDADAGTVQGRDLVAERLAAAGRHQDKGVLPADQPVDDLLLQGAEGVVTEDGLQGLAGRGHRGRVT